MPTRAVRPRAGLPRRAWMRLGYHWRNSGDATLTALRTAWDTRGRAVLPTVRSELGGMSVSYSGLADGLAYTLEFTELRRENGSEQARRASSVLTARQLRDPDQLPDADVVIVGTSAQRARQLPDASSLIVPVRVHFVVDFQDGAATHRISRREREQFARGMREHRWTWELEQDEDWFDVFYDRYYRPTMLARHGARERTETPEVSYECLYRSGRMFVLREGDERVAGALCHWHPRSGTLTLRLLGVRDGATDHYDSGAFKAIYPLLIAWCADNGVRRLDFQGTEPFLSKGTYQWKRRFGTRVVLPPNHFGRKRLWVQVRRDTPAVRDFLVANPLLAEDQAGGLQAVYFHDTDRPAAVHYSAKSPGVDGARHVDLDEFLAGARPDPARRVS